VIDKIIKLADKVKYVLLDETELGGIKYYLGLQLNDIDEPTNKYLYFEEKKEHNNVFLKPICDDKMKDLLLTSFTVNYLDKVYDGV